MKPMFPLEKDTERELPIPEQWRSTISEIVSAIKSGDNNFSSVSANVIALSQEDFHRITSNICAYGDRLVELPAESWVTSVYRYSVRGWEVMIDLFTEREGASDLVLFLLVKEIQNAFTFEVCDIHVP